LAPRLAAAHDVRAARQRFAEEVRARPAAARRAGVDLAGSVLDSDGQHRTMVGGQWLAGQTCDRAAPTRVAPL
jgi:hypothetical protein